MTSPFAIDTERTDNRVFIEQGKRLFLFLPLQQSAQVAKAISLMLMSGVAGLGHCLHGVLFAQAQ